MSLSDEDKARIRREEEARLRAEEEERYRAKVRAELEEQRYRAEVRAELESEGTAPDAPRKIQPGESFVWNEAAPGTEPARQALPQVPDAPARAALRAVPAPGRRPSATPWWALAGLLLAGALTATALAFVLGTPSPAARGTDVELTLRAAGPIKPLPPPPWRASDLATDEYALLPDGSVERRPGRGLETFEAWKAAYLAPPPVMRELFPERLSLPELEALYRTSPPPEGGPRMRLPAYRGGSAPAPGGGATPAPEVSAAGDLIDSLLRVVPPQAWLVVGFSADGIARSPALARVHADLARELGESSPLDKLGGRTLLAEAKGLVYAAVLDGVDPEDEFIVSASVKSDQAVQEAALAGGAKLSEGAVPWLALPGGEALIIEPGRFALAMSRSKPAMLAARASDSVLWSGPMSAVLRRVRGASAGFAVVHARVLDKQDLDAVAAGLGAVEVAGATIDVGAEVRVTLLLAFADMTTATRVLGELERRRTDAAASPHAALLGRVASAIDGSLLTLTLSLSEDEVASLLGEAGMLSK